MKFENRIPVQRQSIIGTKKQFCETFTSPQVKVNCMSIAVEAAALGATFLLNLPFGYWRRMTRKMSKEWFLAIHSPVPLVFLTRFLAGVSLTHIPLFILSFFLGQFTGGRIRGMLERKYRQLSKCLIVDLTRILKRDINGLGV